MMCIRYKENRRWTVGELIEALGRLDPNRQVEVEVDYKNTSQFEIGTGLRNSVELTNIATERK